MGTNYYWRANVGTRRVQYHVGKSSGGWCFALHVLPEHGINSLEDWKRLFDQPGSLIVDEYEQEVPIAEMLRVITERKALRGIRQPVWTAERFRQNHRHAEPGPNGLARAVVDGRYCVGHGEGTWDLVPGEFS